MSRKITDHTAITNAQLAAGDVLEWVDTSDTTDAPSGTNKKMTSTELDNKINAAANVALNTTHRGSNGTDHSNVGLNDTHRGSDGSDHTFIDQDVTISSSPTLDGTNITGVVTGTVEIVHTDVRKGSAGTIPAATPVYLSGYNVGGWIEVEAADAAVAATMPAIGMHNAGITNSATVQIVTSGTLTALVTTGEAVNDAVYVANGGGWTTTKPIGTDLIQKIGIIARVHGSLGVMVLVGAGRTNDLPNLPQNNMWTGNPSAVPTASSTPTAVGFRNVVQALSDGATIAVDFANGHDGTVTVAGDRAMGAPSNIRTGSSGVFTITCDGTARTLTWNAAYRLNGATAPSTALAVSSINKVFWHSADGSVVDIDVVYGV